MATHTVEEMIDGGKASAGSLGKSLGPLKINMGEVVKKINDKTGVFKGMQVPVKITVDTDTKEFEIEVGTPPTSELIKKEANIEKGSGNPLADKVADVKIEQVIKVAKMKESSIMGVNLKNRVKEVMGTCNSLGILVEGVSAKQAIQMANEGKFDEEIRLEKTEISAEELKALEEEKKRLLAESERRYAEEEAKARAIVKSMEGKPTGMIKAKMVESGLSTSTITKIVAELAPAAAAPGAAAPGAAPGAAPAAAKAPEKK